jgi:hypothetical protein
MNKSIQSKTDIILQHAQPGIRDELSRHLSQCGFTDPDDPVLNALVTQSILAGQPISLIEQGGSALATETGLARLGDRIENTAWSVAKMKLFNVLIACGLSAFFAASLLLATLKFGTPEIGRYLGLSAASDDRIKLLDGIGASLRVKNSEGTIYVYFKGNLQPKTGHTDDGVNYLYFKQ